MHNRSKTSPPHDPLGNADAGRVRKDPDSVAPQRSALRADLDRYVSSYRAHYPAWRAWLHALTEYSFIAVAVYRYGRWARSVRPRLLAAPLLLLYHFLAFTVHVLFGIDLSSNCVIGPGLYIAHFGGIIVCGKLGSNCSIGQGVTIGAKGAGRSCGYPEIGDRVYVGAGAMVIGNIRVGDDVVIGANTVVVQDIPSGSRVVSAAVRILPRRSEPDDRNTPCEGVRAADLHIVASAGSSEPPSRMEPR
jgi:serine O-acetyltransferase